MKNIITLTYLFILSFCSFGNELTINNVYNEYMKDLAGSDITKNSLLENDKNHEDGLFYFISFSMRDEAIQEIMNEANQYNIPIYINGLINNSLKETTEKFIQLFGENTTNGIAIDPTKFRQFDIKAVPVLIARCGDNFDKVSGNIPIKQALTKVFDDGDCSHLINDK